MTHSMHDLEVRTEAAYEEVSCARVDIVFNEREADKVRLQVVIVAILIVPVLVGVAVFAPWFAIFAPLFSVGFLISVYVRRLYWLKNVEQPRLEQRYRRKLTQATEALQAQEDRRQLRLLNPEEYDRIELEVEIKLRKAQEAQEKLDREEYEEALWSEAFSRAISRRSPYAWM